jgi:3-isopropylmalate dehydrogenase
VTRVAVLPGDGIGPEVAAEATRVIDALGIAHSEHPFGGNAILEQGTRFPTRRSRRAGRPTPCSSARVGLPELEGRAVRPEQGLLGLRRELGVYANLRPARAEGIDLVIVRELVGGLYFGEKGTRDDGTWFDTCEYTRPEVERHRPARLRDRPGAGGRADVGRQGERPPHLAALARRRHRARRGRVPDVPLDHALVDSFAMTIVNAPGDDRRRRHGEHLRRHPLRRRGGGHGRPRASPRRPRSATRARAVRAGARVGAADRGQGIANPARCFARVALMLRHGLGRQDEAARSSVRSTRRSTRAPTADLGGDRDDARGSGDAVLARIG